MYVRVRVTLNAIPRYRTDFVSEYQKELAASEKLVF
jgi:hypothetical protein